MKKVNLESIGKQKPLKSRSDKSQDFVWNNQTNNKSVCHACVQGKIRNLA